jgi:uncharacterized protein DUF1579
MTEPTAEQALGPLDALVGEWSITSSLAPDPSQAPRAWTSFEWLPGKRFLVQRWEVDHPDAPDGIAIIGFDQSKSTLLQHYFDSRGVARIYEMTFDGEVWTLERFAARPDFSQRFSGRFDEARDAITGSWESSVDGVEWTHDFDMTYTRERAGSSERQGSG